MNSKEGLSSYKILTAQLNGSFFQMLNASSTLRQISPGVRAQMDRYLKACIEMAADISPESAAHDGASDAQALYTLCLAIVEGREDEVRSQAFFPEAAAYISAHPLNYVAETCAWVYYAAVHGKYRSMALGRYMLRCDGGDSHAHAQLKAKARRELKAELYESGYAGMATKMVMEEVERGMKECFFGTRVGGIYMQGMVHQLAKGLVYRDEECGKGVMEILLDERLPISDR